MAAAKKTKTTARKATAEKIHDSFIVGAGISGIAAAIKLKREGYNDFKIIEKADRVGGTWRENTYPGCGCDVPSSLYSYSFAPNPNWSRSFSGSEEILGYIHHLVAEFKLESHIRFEKHVEDLSFDEKKGVWTATTDKGE